MHPTCKCQSSAASPLRPLRELRPLEAPLGLLHEGCISYATGLQPHMPSSHAGFRASASRHLVFHLARAQLLPSCPVTQGIPRHGANVVDFRPCLDRAISQLKSAGSLSKHTETGPKSVGIGLSLSLVFLAVRAVQELWAVCAFWSISLVFLAVWFALRYQEQARASRHARLTAA